LFQLLGQACLWVEPYGKSKRAQSGYIRTGQSLVSFCVCYRYPMLSRRTFLLITNRSWFVHSSLAILMLVFAFTRALEGLHQASPVQLDEIRMYGVAVIQSVRQDMAGFGWIDTSSNHTRTRLVHHHSRKACPEPRVGTGDISARQQIRTTILSFSPCVTVPLMVLFDRPPTYEEKALPLAGGPV